jgi:flagellar motor switch protein FliN
MNDVFPPDEADAGSVPDMETSITDEVGLKDEAGIETDAVGEPSPEVEASPAGPIADPIEESPMLDQTPVSPSLPEFPVPPATGIDRGDRFRPPVSQIPVEMQAVIGRVKVSVADLMGAEPGARFKLDSKFGEPIELQVNGKRIGYGEIVADDRDNLVGIKLVSLEPDF